MNKIGARIPYCPYSINTFRNFYPSANQGTKCGYDPMIMQRSAPMPYVLAKHDDRVDGWVWKCIKCSNVWSIDHPQIVWFCHEEKSQTKTEIVGLGEAQGSHALGSYRADQQQQMDPGRMAPDVRWTDFSTSG